MARREVIVETFDPDEICWELYGSMKAGLLRELAHEARVVRALTVDSHRSARHAHPVAGPTFQAMMKPQFRKYIEKGGRHADTERDAERQPAPEVRHGRVHAHRA
jgi:hypothetical protein